MATRPIILLLLLVSAALCHRGERSSSSSEEEKRINVTFYREHPELVFRVCGKNFLEFATAVRDIDCPRSRNARSADDDDYAAAEEEEPNLRSESTPEYCCRAGCTYNYVQEQLCGTSSVESLPHRPHKQRRSLRVSTDRNPTYYQQHPQKEFQACGKELLNIALTIDINKCPSIVDGSMQEDGKGNKKVLSNHCCMATCTYESLRALICSVY